MMKLSGRTFSPSLVEHARPRARRRGDDLVVENKSSNVTAEQFRFDVAGVRPAIFGDMGGDDPPVALHYDGVPVDLLPDSELHWNMMVFGQSPPQLRMRMHWLEGGKVQEGTQTISL